METSVALSVAEEREYYLRTRSLYYTLFVPMIDQMRSSMTTFDLPLTSILLEDAPPHRLFLVGLPSHRYP
jgi:hypothetical protein